MAEDALDPPQPRSLYGSSTVSFYGRNTIGLSGLLMYLYGQDTVGPFGLSLSLYGRHLVSLYGHCIPHVSSLASLWGS